MIHKGIRQSPSILHEKSMEYQNKPIKSQRDLIQIHSIFPTQTETLLYSIQSL
jgi:hypothetical protein